MKGTLLPFIEKYVTIQLFVKTIANNELGPMGKLDWLFILFVIALAVGSLLATLPKL